MPPADSDQAGPSPPGRLVVHVLGPPESGKSEVCAALVETFGGELFYIPTAAARRAATDPAFAARARAGTDRRGWLQPSLIEELLGGAGVAAGLFGPSQPGPLVVQGFPVLASQVLSWLRLAARYPGVRLAALEIRVAARVLAIRRAVAQKMTCPSCEPAPSRGVSSPTDSPTHVGTSLLGRPRPPSFGESRPARSPRGRSPDSTPVPGEVYRFGGGSGGNGPGQPGRGESGEEPSRRLRLPADTDPGGDVCAACGRLLVPRLPEDPEDYAARLRRFRRGVGPTRAALSAAGAAWHRIDIQTTREFRDVVAAACAVVVSLTSHDPTHGGPR